MAHSRSVRRRSNCSEGEQPCLQELWTHGHAGVTHTCTAARLKAHTHVNTKHTHVNACTHGHTPPTHTNYCIHQSPGVALLWGGQTNRPLDDSNCVDCVHLKGGGDTCSEGEQSNTPQTLVAASMGQLLSTYTHVHTTYQYPHHLFVRGHLEQAKLVITVHTHYTPHTLSHTVSLTREGACSLSVCRPGTHSVEAELISIQYAGSSYSTQHSLEDTNDSK